MPRESQSVVDGDGLAVDSGRRERRAVLYLVVTCAIWGMGFNWNKEGQAVVADRLAVVYDDAGPAALGPGLFLALRFAVGTILWALVFPRSVRGWSGLTVLGGMLAGAFLAGGMLLQHYGLAYTSESLSAFLTSLCVLFTPLLGVVVLRQRVSPGMWGAVVCATAGVALMTLFRARAGFDRGALLGLLCAVAFSGHILAVDAVGKREDPWRFSLAQFLFGTVFFGLFCVLWPRGGELLSLGRMSDVMQSPRLLGWLALVSTVGTVFTFGMMFRYQPRTTPTRAALTYMSEPVFATLYAWVAAGRAITLIAGIGGLLIIAGNVGAELLTRKSLRRAGRPRRDEIVSTIVD